MELIKLYAARAKIKGDAYKTYEIETIFDSEFQYAPTIDQV